MAAYALGVLITVCVMSVGTDDKSIMVYLTIWTFILLTFYLWLAVAVAFLFKPKIKKFGSTICGIENPDYGTNVSMDNDRESSVIREDKLDIPWFLKLTWLLGNVVQVFEIIVTVIYFSLLFPNMENRGFLFNDLNMHVVNTLFVLIDFCIGARPVHILHFIHPAIYGLAYIIFSVIFWVQNHEKNIIYSVLDWNSPGFAVGLICVLAFVIIPTMQIVYFGLYHLRLRVFTKIYKTSYFQD